MVTGDGQLMRVLRHSINGNARGTESPVTNRCHSADLLSPIANRCHSAAALAVAADIDGVAMRTRQPRARGGRLRNIMSDADIERWHIRMTPETYI